MTIEKSKMLFFSNFFILLATFYCVVKWMLSESGRAYLAELSTLSQIIFYALVCISIAYSLAIAFFLKMNSIIGIKSIVIWDCFLGLIILVPWIGGHMLVKYYYGVPAEIVFLSADSLLKGGLGFSLLFMGFLYNRLK